MIGEQSHWHLKKVWTKHVSRCVVSDEPAKDLVSSEAIVTSGALLLTWIDLNPSFDNSIRYKVWDEIT